MEKLWLSQDCNILADFAVSYCLQKGIISHVVVVELYRLRAPNPSNTRTGNTKYLGSREIILGIANLKGVPPSISDQQKLAFSTASVS